MSDEYTYRQMNDDDFHDDDHDDDDYDDHDEYDEYLYSSWPGIQHDIRLLYLEWIRKTKFIQNPVGHAPNYKKTSSLFEISFLVNLFFHTYGEANIIWGQKYMKIWVSDWISNGFWMDFGWISEFWGSVLGVFTAFSEFWGSVWYVLLRKSRI